MGVKCRIAVREFEPLSLTMERFVSATVRYTLRRFSLKWATDLEEVEMIVERG